MTEPNYEPISIVVAGEKVVLDPANLKFNEATLTQFLDREGSWYDYFGRMLANAEAEAAVAKEAAEVAFLQAFNEYRLEVSSDKRAESMARVENGVIQAKNHQLNAEHKVKLLKQHLRSFDKAHDNAISMGHNLRKEMEMTGNRIYSRPSGNDVSFDDIKLEGFVSRYKENHEESS
jgi:hypothetical protein